MQIFVKIYDNMNDLQDGKSCKHYVIVNMSKKDWNNKLKSWQIIKKELIKIGINKADFISFTSDKPKRTRNLSVAPW